MKAILLYIPLVYEPFNLDTCELFVWMQAGLQVYACKHTC